LDAFLRALADDRPPIEVPWPSLAAVLQPMPGSLIIIMASPGVGKSLLTLAWALRLAQRAKPSEVISLDTPSKLQAARACAALWDVPVSEVLDHPKDWIPHLAGLRYPLRVLDTSINPREVDELLEADTIYFGEAPHLVVVDDLSKILLNERGYEAYDEAFAILHRIARKHKTCIVALNHLRRSGGYDAKHPGTTPVALADGRYTGEGEADYVLGLWRPNPDVLRVGILKNRNGTAHPEGHVWIDLPMDAARVQIRDPIEYLVGVQLPDVFTDEDDEDVDY
jgi:hypothetical protein